LQAFTTDFYIQEILPQADGFTFTLQNAPAGVYALGASAGGLGYQGITSSVAVKFDLFDNAGEGVDSTGFYTNGAAPTIPALDMTTSAVNLGGPDMLHANISYNGSTLTLTLTDTVTGASFTGSTAINIPAIVGANTAYAGFTAGTHVGGATQTILNWTYVASPAATPATATPTFTPAPGLYAGPQSVIIGDATNGAAIYYTTDGSMPGLSSAVYSGPLSVSANETLSAIAAAGGYATSEVGIAAYQIAAPIPSFTPPAGTYSSPQSVTIGDAVNGAVIYYTTNGAVPTTASSVYSAPISVSANETLEAMAVPSGYAASAAGTAAYGIRTATPSFTPGGGTYSSAQSVTISDTTGGGPIYYTTDGTRPTTSSAVYSGPITVSSDETLKAIAATSGYTSSFVGTASYSIRLAAPSFTPAAGTYSSAQLVTIEDGDATIYYTTNGSTPSTSAAAYSGPISVSANETLKAFAVAGGFANSPVQTARYSIRVATPSFTPTAGTYPSAQSVSIEDATGGAAIYYTTDGTTPTTSSALYTGAIAVSASEALKAIAVTSGYTNSFVGTAAYKIK
jgi:hypothetical protein